ncbi:MAG: hypothetical protein Kow0080_02160 [Candidatus Promineifilaceae bacterium]
MKGKQLLVAILLVAVLALAGLGVDWLSRPVVEDVPALSEGPAAGLPGVDSLDALLSQQAPAEQPEVAGFGLAWGVMAGMLLALGWVVYGLRGTRPFPLPANASLPVYLWAVPVLAAAGLGVSVYLAYVETNETAVIICGTVGNCAAVQSSPYAYFLGIPVALLGMANYAGLFVLWLGQMWGNGRIRVWARLGLMVVTFVGILFSIYLTGLEIFVIKAVCVWCISSALITTFLFLLTGTIMNN